MKYFELTPEQIKKIFFYGKEHAYYVANPNYKIGDVLSDFDAFMYAIMCILNLSKKQFDEVFKNVG